MKNRLLLLATTVLLLSPLLAATSDDTDPYSVAFVRASLKMRSEGLIIPKMQTRGERMGDKISIALLKALDGGELSDPLTVRAFLPLIHEAFSEPQYIALDIDKDPKVTMFFLETLERRMNDTQTLVQVQETIRFVREQTARR